MKMDEMVQIYIFGPLKYQFNPTAKLSEDTVVNLPFILNETVEQLFKRLKLSNSDLGECFINHTIVQDISDFIPENARVAIFSHGMMLIDGGLYIKKWKD